LRAARHCHSPAHDKAIITGATGMVGEGVLLECLANPAVEQCWSSTQARRCGARQAREIIHADFFDLGRSSRNSPAMTPAFSVSRLVRRHGRGGLQAHDYDLTLGVAQVLARANPDMTFCYVTAPAPTRPNRGAWPGRASKARRERAAAAVQARLYVRPG